MKSAEARQLIAAARDELASDAELDDRVGMPTSIAHTKRCLQLMREAMETNNWNLVAQAYALLEDDRDVMEQYWGGVVSNRQTVIAA